ncbi:Type I secretion outer membrane protein [Granulibacter bethesdensis]|uniref:Type I secretion outer membrane protein n=2 Tax=Granulibacter bethesdensis TaxID=364410 RepID=A0AAN0RD86_9PROT|nr:Type I secretion outer membrane protein [Granulibacter bethesdensis]
MTYGISAVSDIVRRIKQPHNKRFVKDKGLEMTLRSALMLGVVVFEGLAAFAGSAQARPPVTLREALAAAYSTNPTLLAERAKLRSTDENVPAALSGWRPTVTVSAGPGYGFGQLAFGSFGNNALEQPRRQERPYYSVQGNFSQPIYQGGKVTARTHQAEDSVMAERARLIDTEQTVFINTVNAFTSVVQQQQLVAINVNNESVLARQLQATNDRFRVGEITRTDVAQAEAALAQARALRQTSEGNLQTARATYRQQVGALPQALDAPQPLKLPANDQDAATKLAAVNNPKVVAALYDNATAKDNIDVQYAALMPTLALQTSGYQLVGTSQKGFENTGGTVALQAQIPIYQGGAEYAAIRQARQAEQQSRKQVDDARRTAVQQATSAWQTLIAARAAIQSQHAQVRANEIAVEGVEREALVGSRTTYDVLLQQQNLLQSRTNLVNSLASLINASYGVAQAVGQLNARDLNLPVPLYDETAYYRAVRNRWFGAGDEAVNQPGR